MVGCLMLDTGCWVLVCCHSEFLQCSKRGRFLISFGMTAIQKINNITIQQFNHLRINSTNQKLTIKYQKISTNIKKYP